MSNYDKQYQDEESLFGAAYPEFEAFVKAHALREVRALDLGCGQGRDALMLARHGYQVTAVDASKVGIAQMLAQAEVHNLPVKGVVADIYTYEPDNTFDAIVLDSILHFEKADKAKELALLDKLVPYINENGYFFIFVHKSPKKEKELHKWLASLQTKFAPVQDGYISMIYEEKSSGFRSEFEMYYFFLQRIAKR